MKEQKIALIGINLILPDILSTSGLGSGQPFPREEK